MAEHVTLNIREFEIETMPISCTLICVGPPGSGKCHGKDTKIMSYDGSIVNVQDIKIGDKIMGQDSNPKNILSVCHGNDTLYNIYKIYPHTQNKSKYVVNKDHILVYVNEKGEYYEKSVKEILKEDNMKRYGFKRSVLSFENTYKYNQMTISEAFELGKSYSTLQSSSIKTVEGIPDEIKYSSYNIRLNFIYGFLSNYDGVYIPHDNIQYIIYKIEEKNGGIMEDYLFMVNTFENLVGERDGKYINIYEYSSRVHHEIEIEEKGKGDYYGFEITGDGLYMLDDCTITHNTTLMNYIVYYKKHIYPVARCMSGNPGGFKDMCEVFHPLFCSNKWEEDLEKKHVFRQKTCIQENLSHDPEGKDRKPSGKHYVGNRAINILDDVSDDPKIYKRPVFNQLFKIGAQWYNQLFMLGSQYAIDLPPAIRNSVNYVAIFRCPPGDERKKLYTNFGGICGDYDTFSQLMDHLTGDYTALIIVKRTQSQDLQDCVFYLKADVIKQDFKFGCKEYRDWIKKRYNTEYIEENEF